MKMKKDYEMGMATVQINPILLAKALGLKKVAKKDFKFFSPIWDEVSFMFEGKNGLIQILRSGDFVVELSGIQVTPNW